MFNEPSGLALAGDGTLAVADTWNGRIQLVRPDGSFETLGTNLFGPRDALWAADGSLFVADTGNRRLLRFDPPNWQETVVTTLPGPVTGLAPVLGLVAVAVPVDRGILLVDPSSGEVVRRLRGPRLEQWRATGSLPRGTAVGGPGGHRTTHRRGVDRGPDRPQPRPAVARRPARRHRSCPAPRRQPAGVADLGASSGKGSSRRLIRAVGQWGSEAMRQ